MSRALLPCGTPAAYTRHRKNGEQACRPCLDAVAAYNRQNRAVNAALKARKNASREPLLQATVGRARGVTTVGSILLARAVSS